MKDYCKGDMQKWAKKLTKKQAQEVLRKVLGEWRTEDLPNNQMLDIWKNSRIASLTTPLDRST